MRSSIPDSCNSVGTEGKPIPLIMDNLGHRSFFIANLHVLHNHCFESADTYPCEHSRYAFFSNCDLNVKLATSCFFSNCDLNVKLATS